MLPRAGKGSPCMGMTKHGDQAVMDKLKENNKDSGNGNALDRCKSLRGQDQLECALKLKVGKKCNLHDGH